MKGIDVSGYQGSIDWKKVKAAGVEFAILKIIRKDSTPDNQFENNMAGCAAQNIPMGVYNYSYAATVNKAETDAGKVVSVLGGRKMQCRVWLDVEDDSQKNLGIKLIDIISAYEKVIETAGYEFGVYTGLSFYNSFIKPYAKSLDYPFWIARYPSKSVMKLSANPAEDKKPVIENNLWGWQYSSAGSVDGIAGVVDINIWYGGKGIESVQQEIKGSIVAHSLKTEGSKQISRNFKVSEFACKDGTDKILIDVDFVKNKLQAVRDYFKTTVKVISGYRTPEYNKRIDGAAKSYHMEGMAFDIEVKGRTPEEVALYARNLGINGIIQYNTFVHVDSRKVRYWARNDNGKVVVIPSDSIQLYMTVYLKTPRHPIIMLDTETILKMLQALKYMLPGRKMLFMQTFWQ